MYRMKTEMVTVIEWISADGRVLPPLYICKGFSHLMGWQRCHKEPINKGIFYKYGVMLESITGIQRLTEI